MNTIPSNLFELLIKENEKKTNRTERLSIVVKFYIF